MTQPIDKMYVEIEARGEENAARDIKRILDRIERDIKELNVSLQLAFKQAAESIEREVEEAGDTISREAAKQTRAWSKTAASMAADIEAGAESAARSIDDFADEATRDMDRITRSALRAAVAVRAAGSGGGGGGGGVIGDGDIDLGGGGHFIDIDRDARHLGSTLGALTAMVGDFADAIGEKLGAATGRASQMLGQLAGTLGSIIGPIGQAISSFGLFGAAIILAPGIIALTAALSQLSGLLLMLPGTIGVLVAAIAPLMMAFKGVGDAVSALASGDIEKIDKAFQNISPQARKFAVELHGLRDEMKELKFAVQDAFFKEFNGSLQELVNSTLPMLKDGLSGVSGALGRMASDIAELLGSQDIVEAIGDVFESTEGIIDRLSPKFTDMLGVIIGAIEHSMPFVERFFDAIGTGMEKFTKWLSDAMKTGDFERWLENAFTIAKDLWGLLKSLGRLLGAIFGGLGDEGDSLIVTLTKIVDKMTEFFESAEGKQQVQDIVNGFLEFANALITVVGWVRTLMGWWASFTGAITTSGDKILAARDAVVDFFRSAWEWVQSAGSTIGGWFTSLGDWFSGAWNTVTTTGGNILTWFQELPGRIGEWLASLPGVLSDAFKRGTDQILYWIGFAFGWVARETLALPGRVWGGLQALWQTFTDWFTRTRDNITRLVTQAVNAVVDWFQRLPGRVSSALSSLWNTVSDWFSRTSNRATSSASSTINSVVGWFQKLPGRAADAIRSLPGRIADILRNIVSDARNIGHDIMDGIARGIRNGVNSAINAARHAAWEILSGFWDAFNIGSPSKLMRDEVGVPIMQGIGVGVERETPNLRDTINSAVNTTAKSAGDNAVVAGAQGGESVASQGNGSIVINSLTIPITGTFDFTDPQTSRRVAMQVYEALRDLQRDYR